MNSDPNDSSHAGEDSEPFMAIEVPLHPDFNRTRWNIYVSWIVILTVSIGMFSLVFIVNRQNSQDTEATQAEMMAINSQAKIMVGMKEITDAPIASQLDDMNRGALEQRYGIVLLKNDLVSAKDAEKLLFEIDDLAEKQKHEPSETQIRLRAIVGQLLQQYKLEQWDSNTVSAEDRIFLVEQMGWIGRLGLTPQDSPNVAGREELTQDAKNSTYAYMTVLGGGALLGLLGVFAAITMFVLMVNRKVQTHFVNRRDRSVIYLETFAIWIVGFFVVTQLLGAFVVEALQLQSGLGRTAFQLAMFFGSLMVLAWPVMRGLTFRQVREDIGWTCKNPIKEIGSGIFAYAALAPFIGAFMIVFLIIMSSSMQADADSLAPTGGGAHPIQDQIATGSFTAWLGVFLMAVVAAPIVEETMFRGVFYRYLKDVSNHRKFWFSVFFACLINGIIFASLHPQGLVGIPFLTLLAVGMSLARQWRDSLVASMTMHAINNGLITCLMFAMF